VRRNGAGRTPAGCNRSYRLQSWIFQPVELSPARQARAQGRIPEPVRPLSPPPVEQKPPSGPKRAPRARSSVPYSSPKKWSPGLPRLPVHLLGEVCIANREKIRQPGFKLSNWEVAISLKLLHLAIVRPTPSFERGLCKQSEVATSRMEKPRTGETEASPVPFGGNQ